VNTTPAKVGKLAVVQGLLLMDRIAPKVGIPILYYHRVSPNIGREHVHSIYPEEFEWQMRWLAERGYRVIGLDEVVDCLDRGATDKCVALTFDDGHRDILRYAAPILRRYSARATVFVVSAYVGRRGWLTADGGFSESGPGIQRWELLSWDELKQGASVFDLGVHGKTHRPLTALSDAEIASELDEARNTILRQTGVHARFYCYPYGLADERTAAAVRRAGFRGACGTEHGLNTPENDRFLLCRNQVGQGLREAQFSLLMTEYVRTYRRMGRWLRR
jgi:peptidoglycan/xylan/chitin deacetylase (PgdA/CDA1 family)